MKKRFLTILFVLSVASVLSVNADPIILTGGRVTPYTTGPGHGKAPMRPWIIDVSNNIISMEATPCDYTLNLYDEDEDVVYSVFVPAGTTQVVLPTTLSGSFELRFETETYYYYGFIYL